MPKETRPAMEKLPFKPSYMDSELESIYDPGIGWKEAPSASWPTEQAILPESEDNHPISPKKIASLEDAIRKITNSL